MGKGEVSQDRGRLELYYREDKYAWTLTQDLRDFARKDLREDTSSRDQAIAQLRLWLRKNPQIKKCRMDSRFLLRFLRMKKFSVPMAQETLLNYLLMRHQQPEWCLGLDINDSAVNDLISRGLVFPLPERDEHGRKIIFSWGGAIDPKVHRAEDVIRAGMLSFEALMEDEENQICGYTYIVDEKAITLAHLVLWNPAQITTLLHSCERSMPMRHKQIHILNLPTTLHAVFEFAKSLFSVKIQHRFQLHTNEDSLKKHFNPKVLPKEYGGEIPMQVMIDRWKQELTNRREQIRAIDEMQVDISKVEKEKQKETDTFGVNGSFRKLEID